jgi:phenylacetic acid degradation protein
MNVAEQTLVAGVPAKLIRSLTDEEVAWKRTGTQTYQDLSRRCLATMQEVHPLAQSEPNRPSVQAPLVKSLIASRRD